jgi:hypothetical protein
VQPEVPAGWYPHPTAPGWEAYWTGNGWGSETRPAQQAPPTAPEQATAATPAAEAQGAAAEPQHRAAVEPGTQPQHAADARAVPEQRAETAATAAPATAAATAAPSAAEGERSRNALPMLVCVLGALVAIVGAFLPAAKLDFGGTSIDLIDNTMVVAGYGIAVIAAAVLGAGIAIWAHLKGAASWLPILLGVVILAIAVYAGTAGLEVTPDFGTLGADTPSLDDAGDPSTGIFAAGIGGLLMILGGLGLARARR